jgi:hypothetical protein
MGSWVSLGVLACGLISCCVAQVAGGGKDNPGGTVVTVDELKSKAPANWKPEEPANRLRSYQFRLPRGRDDKEDAQLVVIPDLTGTPEQNIKRWKEMFEPPEGKTMEDAARVVKSKVASARLTYLDVQGTYLYTDRPLAPRSTAKPLPGYRMLAVMFQTLDSSALVRLIGPQATVAQHKPAFDQWLNSFK